MSLRLRLAALALFLVVLVGNPASIQGEEFCGCEIIVEHGPFAYLECIDQSCYDLGYFLCDCLITDCMDYEAGAGIQIQCF